MFPPTRLEPKPSAGPQPYGCIIVPWPQKPPELLAPLGLAYDVCWVFSQTYIPKYCDTIIYEKRKNSREIKLPG